MIRKKMKKMKKEKILFDISPENLFILVYAFVYCNMIFLHWQDPHIYCQRSHSTIGR